MEDKRRDLGSHNGRIRAVRENFSDSSKLTIMVVRGLGKVRSLNVSPRLLFWSSLFFVLYLIASVFIINDYLKIRRENQTHLARLKNMEHQISETKRSMYRSNQRLALLKEYIHRLESGSLGKQEQPLRAKKEPESQQESVSGESKEETLESMVEVKNLAVERDESKLRVSFRLFNVRNDDLPVRGYVHLVAVDDNSEPPRLWSYPRETLRSGLPVNYRRGQRFFINNFKTIRGEYVLNKSENSPSSMRVIVYNESGKLILDRLFELEDVS